MTNISRIVIVLLIVHGFLGTCYAADADMNSSLKKPCSACPQANQGDTITMQQKQALRDKLAFTQADSKEMMDFEKDIAYFYGAKDPEKVSSLYIKAIQALEELGLKSKEETLQAAMLGPLNQAYAEVKHQTNLTFNPTKAAVFEFQLILAQAQTKPFEDIYSIMMNLYHEVFSSEDPAIHKAAMLRTFLYKYKISLLKQNNGLSDSDKLIIQAIAEESVNALNSLIKEKS